MLKTIWTLLSLLIAISEAQTYRELTLIFIWCSYVSDCVYVCGVRLLSSSMKAIAVSFNTPDVNDVLYNFQYSRRAARY